MPIRYVHIDLHVTLGIVYIADVYSDRETMSCIVGMC